jgi:hypothetical protein
MKKVPIYGPHSLPSKPWLLVRQCPKILKIWQITNFDMGFQKKKMFQADLKTSIFFHRRFSREPLLKLKELIFDQKST